MARLVTRRQRERHTLTTHKTDGAMGGRRARTLGSGARGGSRTVALCASGPRNSSWTSGDGGRNMSEARAVTLTSEEIAGVLRISGVEVGLGCGMSVQRL